MGNRHDHLVSAIVDVCHRLAAGGWVANHDGNVSARLDDQLLATPTALAKADVTPELILTLDGQGRKVAGIGKPFSEIQLHLAAYTSRPETQAVVHAHPPMATARGLCGGDLAVFLPEAIVSIGRTIPVVPYAMPGSTEGVTALSEGLRRSDVVMLAGNGALAVGRDVMEAYLRLELLEHLLKIEFCARAMGPMRDLPAEDVRQLLEKRAALGLGPQAPVPPAAPQVVTSAGAAPTSALVRQLIADELKKILGGKS